MLTEHLKRRFCKDNNLSINIFDEPYFSNRLDLVGKLDKFNDYIKLIEDKFNNNEEAYFAYYNDTKDKIIDYIKESKAYNMLQNDNMMKYVRQNNYPSTDVYKETNIGKYFVSIDMNKANFTALVHYGRNNNCAFADNSFDYNKFISKFTDIDHIIDSKYIRQVVFGNCNPKRQITYETYLMSCLLEQLIMDKIISEKEIYAVRADEIIITKSLNDDDFRTFNATIHDICDFPIKIESFQIGKITNSQAYVKRQQHTWGTILEPKCVSPDEMPFVYKLLQDKPFSSDDMVFSYNGKLAKFLDIPQMEITYDNNNV